MTSLKLNPAFADYMGEAFKPLGVYLNFFQPTLEAGKSRSFRVMMVNDLYEPARGELRLTLEGEDGREVAHATSPFELAPLGTLTRDLELVTPEAPGPLPAEGHGDRRGRLAHVSRRPQGSSIGRPVEPCAAGVRLG